MMCKTEVSTSMSGYWHTGTHTSRRANEVFAVAFGYVGIGLKLVALTYNKVRVKPITPAAALTEIFPSGTVHWR